MIIVNNIASLKSVTSLPSDSLAYVQGHTSQSDGGGGMFQWRTDSDYTGTGLLNIDNNGTVVSSNTNPNGKWVRQYDSYINVLFFGAFGKDQDYTTHIQNAIDFGTLISVSNLSIKGATVFFPNGKYRIKHLLLKSNISLIGESIGGTHLVSNDIGTQDQFLFDIDFGAVYLDIKNFTINGKIDTNTNKGCFLFEAKSDPVAGHGGLWYSRLSNISIVNFNGNSIYLKGGTNWQLPNQFNIFENVRVLKGADWGYALKISGQCGQHTFLNCQFDGFYRNDTFSLGPNVYILTPANSPGSAVISFINSTFQDSDYGVLIDNSENITFDNCWLENLGVAIVINNSNAINVLNSRFANAAGFGKPTPHNIVNGQNINITNSFVNVHRNFVSVSNISQISSGSAFFSTANNILGAVNLSDNYFADLKLSAGFNTNSIVGGGQIVCGGNKYISLKQTGANFNAISSKLNPGEYLTVTANGTINFNQSASLLLAGKTLLQLLNNEVATFLRLDGNGSMETFTLISFSKANSV